MVSSTYASSSPDLSPWGRAFVVVAFLEATTWAGLLVGMYLKYVTESTDVGVAVFGALHGAAFMIYVGVTVTAAWRLRWSVKVALIGLAAGVPPLATLPFEWWARRAALLSPRPHER